MVEQKYVDGTLPSICCKNLSLSTHIIRQPIVFFSCTNQINPSQVLDNIFAEEYAYKWTNVNHTKSEISILKLVISYELIHINVHLLCHNTCFCSMRPCPRETGNGVANWHMIETFPPLYRVIFHYTS